MGALRPSFSTIILGNQEGVKSEIDDDGGRHHRVEALQGDQDEEAGRQPFEIEEGQALESGDIGVDHPQAYLEGQGLRDGGRHRIRPVEPPVVHPFQVVVEDELRRDGGAVEDLLVGEDAEPETGERSRALAHVLPQRIGHAARRLDLGPRLFDPGVAEAGGEHDPVVDAGEAVAVPAQAGLPGELFGDPAVVLAGQQVVLGDEAMDLVLDDVEIGLRPLGGPRRQRGVAPQDVGLEEERVVRPLPGERRAEAEGRSRRVAARDNEAEFGRGLPRAEKTLLFFLAADEDGPEGEDSQQAERRGRRFPVAISCSVHIRYSRSTGRHEFLKIPAGRRAVN